MSRLEKALHNDLQALELIRDEVKLHAHLFKAEMHGKWQHLEADAGKLKSRAAAAVKSTANAEGEAIHNAVETLMEGYKQLRDAVKR